MSNKPPAIPEGVIGPPAADRASAAEGEAVEAQQKRVTAIRHEQWDRRQRDGAPAAGGSDRPDVVSGDIQSSWTWHDETDALIRAAIESANDAIIITGAELDEPGPQIEYVNPAFTAMTGWPLNEILGKTPRILQGPKTDRALLRRLRDDLLNGRSFHGETINYRKDGTEYVVEWRITSMRGPDGKTLKWVAVQRDVSERREAEMRRERQLETERAAREEAERVGRMKDEFLATLSHELRTPLNAILGWTQLLQRGRLDLDERRRAVETVERNARTQAQLIEDLLDMSRILSGNMRLEMKPVALQSVLDAAAQSLRPATQAKGVQLWIEADVATRTVRGDAFRLQQVTWNLLSNALKFTPAGGRITVRLHSTDHHVELGVTDTGIGIDAAFLPFVFDRFRQADGSTTRAQGGLGIGLAIVKQLVELHGGTIEAKSAGLGKGSSFVVNLPLADPADVRAADDGEPASPDDAMPAVRLDGLRVLVVEDDDDARAFVRHVLADAGAIVEGAATVRDALARLDDPSQPPIEFLISDIGMPDTDGYEFIAAVRRLAADRGGAVPAIALTAFARAEDRRRALIAGYQSHLSKPVNAADLLVEIEAIRNRPR